MSLIVVCAVGSGVLVALVIAGLGAAVVATRERRHGQEVAALRDRLSTMIVELAAREGNEALLGARIDKLRCQNADLEQFAHIASHDLRAPLRGIGNLAQWIEEDCGEQISPQGKAHLDLLQSRVRRLQELLRDLLNFSRAGRGEVVVEDVDLSLLVAEIAEESGAGRLDVTIESESPNGAMNNSPTLTTAVTPLRQVLANLISNAVKHSDLERTSVTLRHSMGGQWLDFEVIDDGPGIDPAHFAKALTMFQTLNSTAETVSTGMGLALVKRLVDSAGGELELRSPASEGRGLSVAVRWPLVWEPSRDREDA